MPFYGNCLYEFLMLTDELTNKKAPDRKGLNVGSWRFTMYALGRLLRHFFIFQTMGLYHILAVLGFQPALIVGIVTFEEVNFTFVSVIHDVRGHTV